MVFEISFLKIVLLFLKESTKIKFTNTDFKQNNCYFLFLLRGLKYLSNTYKSNYQMVCSCLKIPNFFSSLSKIMIQSFL